MLTLLILSQLICKMGMRRILVSLSRWLGRFSENVDRVLGTMPAAYEALAPSWLPPGSLPAGSASLKGNWRHKGSRTDWESFVNTWSAVQVVLKTGLLAPGRGERTWVQIRLVMWFCPVLMWLQCLISGRLSSPCQEERDLNSEEAGNVSRGIYAVQTSWIYVYPLCESAPWAFLTERLKWSTSKFCPDGKHLRKGWRIILG